MSFCPRFCRWISRGGVDVLESGNKCGVVIYCIMQYTSVISKYSMKDCDLTGTRFNKVSIEAF